MAASEVDLDNTDELAAIDPAGMLSVLDGFPAQVAEALEIGRSDVALPPGEGVRAVTVLGMGGSGVSGDVVSALVADRLHAPVVSVKGYRLPAFVDSDTLVFAVSYSGNTEETLDCLEQARERGAAVVGVSSGGRLSGLAAEKDFPLFKIPGGLQPRASLPYLFVPIISALERMGLVSGVVERVRAAVGALEERRREFSPDNPLDQNPTKRLARDLVGYLPVVYGSEGRPAVAAMRWKTQFNENSKVPAFYHWFPELNHNETVGWQHLEEVSSRCYLIVLREKGEHPRVAKRIDITLDLISDRLGHVTQVCARGDNPVERMLDLIYFGDYTSVYLALALGQDPTPVTRIEELKRRLAEESR